MLKQTNKKQYEETNQAPEPDLEMTEVLELSDQEFKIAIINLLRALMGKKRTTFKNTYKQRDGKFKKISLKIALKIKYLEIN